MTKTKKSILWTLLIAMLCVTPLMALADDTLSCTEATWNELGELQTKYPTAVLTGSAKVYDRFGEAYSPAETIALGTEVSVVEERGELIKVIYADGERCGWVEAGLVKLR